MKARNLIPIAASLLFVLLLPATAAASNCDVASGNCFLLRAPAGLQQNVVSGHGLTVKRQVTAGDPDLIVVEGPANILPEVTFGNLHADPDVLEVDLITLEALAETDGDSALELSSRSSAQALIQSGSYVGDENSYFKWAQWNGYLGQDAIGLVQLARMRDVAAAESFGSGIVAVIDTGVDPEHPGFELPPNGGSALVSGYDFLLGQPGIPSEWNALDPATAAQDKQDLEAAGDQSYSALIEGGDLTMVSLDASADLIVDQSYSALIEGLNLPPAFGHGTMVAGLVRAVAPAAKIMPLRVFDGNGMAAIDDVVEAIYFAVDNGADVINMSFSVSESNKALQRAIMHADRNKVVLVSSAGNEGTSQMTYPAAYGDVIGVGSTDLSDNYSSFSSRGPHVFLSAPGESVATYYPGNNYAYAWGTSFSSALTAGAVALLHGWRPDGSFDPVAPRNSQGGLEDSADPIVGQTPDMGAGRLDAEGAYNLNKGNPDDDS